MQIKADLHMHSKYSDGEDTPEMLVQRAKALGLQLISLTDHDTIDGVSEMVLAGKRLGIKVISGVELSCDGGRGIHMLGYGVDISNKEFVEKMKSLRQKRLLRVERIASKLKHLGIDITAAEILEGVDEDTSAGRVHIAKILIKKGIVADISEAFEKFLAYGKPAYERSEKLLPEEAIQLIKNAGGKAVLAHPYLLKLEENHMYELVKSLAEKGLSGIEADYFAHNSQEKSFYRALAEKYSLICTCGSDYHGKIRQITDEVQTIDEKAYKLLLS